jgi:hypothetical protein
MGRPTPTSATTRLGAQAGRDISGKTVEDTSITAQPATR